MACVEYFPSDGYWQTDFNNVKSLRFFLFCETSSKVRSRYFICKLWAEQIRPLENYILNVRLINSGWKKKYHDPRWIYSIFFIISCWQFHILISLPRHSDEFNLSGIYGLEICIVIIRLRQFFFGTQSIILDYWHPDGLRANWTFQFEITKMSSWNKENFILTKFKNKKLRH